MTFVSMVPDKNFRDRLSRSGTAKQEFREGTEEVASGVQNLARADRCKEGEGTKLFTKDEDGRVTPAGEDRSLFVGLMEGLGLHGGGPHEATVPRVAPPPGAGNGSGGSVNVNVSGVAVPAHPGSVLVPGQ
jgi:hypothetical protein